MARRKKRVVAVQATTPDEGRSKLRALLDADNVAIVSDLIIGVPLDEDRLRERLRRLRDRMAVEAGEALLRAYGKGKKR